MVQLESAVITDCDTIIRDFALSLTIFTKFEEIWKKIGINDKSLNKACTDKLKKTAWLIFIIAKVRILQRRGDLVDFAYLLVSVIYFVMLLAPDEVVCDVLEKFRKEEDLRDEAAIPEKLK